MKQKYFPFQDIAHYIIWKFQEAGEPLTNLKLQKLLYYAQGWHLALYNKPLFKDKIEAWVHGPVIVNAYREFKQYGYGLITKPGLPPHLPKQIHEHLDEIIEVYGSYSAFELEYLTHQSDPWREARGDLPIDQSSDAEIYHQDMTNYFKKKMVNG